MDGSIRSNEVRHAHPKPQTLPQGADHGQVEEAGEEGPHSRLWEEGHGVDTEPQESRLQQDLPEDHVQHLGPVQVTKLVGPAPAGLFFCGNFYHTDVTQNRVLGKLSKQRKSPAAVAAVELSYSAPDRIRTCNLLIRSQLL